MQAIEPAANETRRLNDRDHPCGPNLGRAERSGQFYRDRTTLKILTAAVARRQTSQDWIAGIAAFKAMLLEGQEVIFIVIAVSAGRGMLWPASLGARAACLLVLLVGAIAHRPLARVPENTLKFGVGVMLSAFGVFWTGEGLGVVLAGARPCPVRLPQGSWPRAWSDSQSRW